MQLSIIIDIQVLVLSLPIPIIAGNFETFHKVLSHTHRSTLLTTYQENTPIEALAE